MAPVSRASGSWRGHQAQDQLLVRLSRGVDPDVGQRRRREQPAQQVERLGPDRAGVRGLGLASPRGKRSAAQASRARGSPSRSEERVHRLLVLGPERGVAPVAVAAASAPSAGHGRVVGDVAGGLLEIGGQPARAGAPWSYVGDPFAGHVHAAELRHRVIAVAQEDPPVERGRALTLARRRRPRRAPRLPCRPRTPPGRAAGASRG